MNTLENLPDSITEIQGERIRLRPFTKEDIPTREIWAADSDTFHLIAGRPPDPEELDMKVWFECLMDNPYTAVLSIEDEDGTYIGDIELHVENIKRRALGLNILIGERGRRGGGYGTEALRTLLKFVFENLRAFVVYLNVFDFNRQAIRCYEKCGFLEVDRTVVSLNDDVSSYWLTMSCTPGTFTKAAS